MPQILRKYGNRKYYEKKFTLLRSVVIILSFISLLSRIIYCTYATWLAITTFDCIPCANTSIAVNGTTDLFISHHSSAIFKTIRALNIKSAETIPKTRKKRSKRSKVRENYSQVFNNGFDVIERKPQMLSKEVFNQMVIELNAEFNESETKSNASEDNSVKEITKTYDFFANDSKMYESVDENKVQNESNPFESSFGNESYDSDSSEEQNHPILQPLVSEHREIEEEKYQNEPNISNRTAFQVFTYIPTDHLFQTIDNLTNENNDLEDMENLEDFSSNSHSEHNLSESGFDGNDFSSESNSMTIVLDEQNANKSNNSVQEVNAKRNVKSLSDYQLVNDSSFLSEDNTLKRIPMNVCSEDCAHFLNFELNDPKVRKWITLMITGILFLYALVMFSIFIGACLALVDLLIISTFIEGAKLFAGFILIIIDSFNGKEVHFNLIDIKFNVNTRGNGWTADFSYSEYLLDIIIFLVSALLCYKAFKSMKKRDRNLNSIEDFETRGTYRSNRSKFYGRSADRSYSHVLD